MDRFLFFGYPVLRAVPRPGRSDVEREGLALAVISARKHMDWSRPLEDSGEQEAAAPFRSRIPADERMRPVPGGKHPVTVMFEDRVDAGQQLGRRLAYLRGHDAVVLGLPRGGVPVAFQIAKMLDAPLDVIVVRKLGVPSEPEVAMGAIGEEGGYVLDQHVLSIAKVRQDELLAVERRERAELDQRLTRIRRGRARIDLTGRTAVVVDDGIATGSTARVACILARKLGAGRVVLAVPVAPADVVAALEEPDEVVCLAQPRRLAAIGYHYRDFSPTSEDEVLRLLDAAAADRAEEPSTDRPSPGGAAAVDEDVHIPVEGTDLEGRLFLPGPASGIVVFAHGSGSSRHSPRNRFVASELQEAGLGTLLLDLLSPGEELNRANVFNVELLAGRLGAATDWLGSRPDVESGHVGYFGASTGAAAALLAAADADGRIGAVVSRGGRPDLAGAKLGLVRAPTLLIVGSADHQVVELNREAQALMRCTNRLELVPGATHLFEEPGTLEKAAALARDWFVHYLGR
jgi:putative phosphoribosyl transferase